MFKLRTTGIRRLASSACRSDVAGQVRYASGNKDYYRTLGVSPQASAAEIKKAYRQKAITHHPDQGGKAEDFAEINEAYEVLSNEEKRQVYDQMGSEAAQQASGPSGMDVNPEAMFREFFGDFGKGFRSEARRTPDVHAKITCTLEDIYLGAEKMVRVQRPAPCVDCKGNGTKSGQPMPKCSACNGKGKTVQVQNAGGGMFHQITSVCSRCEGLGKKPSPGDVCRRCRGEGSYNSTDEIRVQVPKGCPSGVGLRMPGQGGSLPGTKPSDLIIHVEQLPHRIFTRRGNDLLMNLEITLPESLLGFERTLKMLDGRTVVLRSPPNEIVQSSSVIRVSGEGMPSDGGLRGHLYAFITVKKPRSLTPEQREALEKVFGSVPRDTSAKNVLRGELLRESKEQFEASKARQWSDGDHSEQTSSRGGGGIPKAECVQQ